jgi:hypothetical protein
VCQFCGTTRSAEWRRGPAGTKSYPFALPRILLLFIAKFHFIIYILCNACGLHYSKTLKKEGMVAQISDAPPKVMSVNNLLN